jgi:DNA-directed RNA polymerase specialized sigma24 family protein
MSSFEQLFRDNLELIEKVIAYACRRSHMRPEETEDFRAAVLLKLMDDDYAVFRKFQGNSSLKTYLTTVILRFLQDHQTRMWGRWRPCAEAERQGPLAKLLDRLTDRDGYGFDEACQTLWTN